MRQEITKNGYLVSLDNGFKISVVGGDGLYGNGKTSFEIGLWYEQDGIKTPLKVAGWQSEKQVNKIIKTLKRYE